MILNIYRRKPKSKDRSFNFFGNVKWVMCYVLVFLLISHLTSLITPVYATYDPTSLPNNKYGIHLISVSAEEITSASNLVNSNGGDWGYVTFLIESQKRDHERWQKVFDSLREQHLIPLVRLATEPSGNNWKRPYEGEEEAWADFLDALNWPTKNRYVIIYNEPNQGHEWDGQVDPKDYAQTLDKTITALKMKSSDFFVLNGGFDASAPNKPPSFEEELNFIKNMNDAIPGIFNRLDGWVSHSYPNPEFSAPPDKTGKGSIRTWVWELAQLKDLGVTKDLPIFIAETGWKHAEGKVYDLRFPSAEQVGNYFDQAFKDAWSSSRIITVTPFILDYQEDPFDHFSFRKYTGHIQDTKLLGAEYPDYYPQYQKIINLPKISGAPIQDTQAQLVKGEIYPALVSGESYSIPLTFKNTGQSIWNEGEIVKLVPLQGGSTLNLQPIQIPINDRVKPGDDYTFNVVFKSPLEGKFKVSFNLFKGDKQFPNNPFEFNTEIKSPVVLKVKASLKWKNDSSGNYLLTTLGLTGQKVNQVILGTDGASDDLESRYLPPDLTYNFTLERQFYQPKTIKQKVTSGENIIDFGDLQPDIPSAILHPSALWKLLPWSN